MAKSNLLTYTLKTISNYCDDDLIQIFINGSYTFQRIIKYYHLTLSSENQQNVLTNSSFGYRLACSMQSINFIIEF